jgi:very-short-patch-repair endonuclease
VLGESLGSVAEEPKNRLRELCIKDGFRVEGNTVSFHDQHGVKGSVKNLIFAANGFKPDIVLIDSVNNDIQIVLNEQYCLVYTEPIPEHGLLWKDLTEWWRKQEGNNALTGRDLESSLYQRLYQSLSSEPEKLLFNTYCTHFRNKLGDALYALIPQVYLHYDPYTIRQLSNGKRLPRQRMDFLMLFSNHVRIVLEVDGQQHYSENDKASPRLYAEMVAEDRRLRLAGYEIYRFGGHELRGEAGKQVVVSFFQTLFEQRSIMHSAKRERQEG